MSDSPPEPLGSAVLAHLRAHRSIRDFAPEPVDDADVLEVVGAAQCAATSSALQAYTLFRVRDDGHRDRLVDLCGGQPWIRAAGAFFCVCADVRRLRHAAELHGLARRENLESFLLGALDTALFAQNLAIGFEAKGYGICFIGGLRNRLDEVDRLLGVPDGVWPLFGLCVGRAAHDPGRRPRLATEAVLEDGAWHSTDRIAELVAEYDDRMRAYYAGRGKPGYDWSTGSARKFRIARREGLADYLASKGAQLR